MIFTQENLNGNYEAIRIRSIAGEMCRLVFVASLSGCFLLISHVHATVCDFTLISVAVGLVAKNKGINQLYPLRMTHSVG